MLEGKWPEKNCLYCKLVEDVGGTSDRMRQLSVPYVVPPELKYDHDAVNVSPTLLEVYFNNTCNLGCLYCSSSLSSMIAAENETHGDFQQGKVWLTNKNLNYKDLVPYFWEWFAEKFSTISRFHVLGGEPLYQKEFEKLLEMVDRYPNPDCELNIVTNLAVSAERLKQFVEKFKSLLSQRKLKRIDITCSIDCWGKQQEYVRWGLDLKEWEVNFQTLVNEFPNIQVCVNSTINSLSIKTMPELLEKINEANSYRKNINGSGIIHSFNMLTEPKYMDAKVFPSNFFDKDFEKIL
jgi:organic radical activating enzyme